MREIWKGIKEFKASNSKISNKNNITNKILRAYTLLLPTGEERRRYESALEPYVEETLETLGKIDPCNWILKKEEKKNYEGPLGIAKFLLENSRERYVKEQVLCGKIPYRLRCASVHTRCPITFYDVLIAFRLLLKAFKIDIDFNLHDSYPEFSPDSTKMIDSICNSCCDTSNRCTDGKSKCSGVSEGILKRSAYLSSDIGKSIAAKDTQDLFCYLYLLQGFDVIKSSIPQDIIILINKKLTRGGKFCPPFTSEGYWVGKKGSDGTLDSPFGKLSREMYKEIGEENDGKIFFIPQKKFFRKESH